MESSIKQLKLVNGEELVCEIIDEAPDSFAVRNAYRLVERTTEDGYKYYTFRTFMIYQDTPLSVMLIMSDKIMGMAIPSDEMIDQYNMAIEEMMDFQKEDEATQIKQATEGFEDELDDYINECQVISLFDSDTTDMLKH